MWFEIAAGILILSQFIYHRWIEEQPKPKPARELSLPRTDNGATYPLIYGRCRVRAPILAWVGTPFAHPGEGSSPDLGPAAAGMPFLYCVNMLVILGIPHENGHNRVHRIFAGEKALFRWDFGGQVGGSGTYVNLNQLIGNGNNEYLTRVAVVAILASDNDDSTGFVGGGVEFLDGRSSQQLRNETTPFSPTTVAARYMHGPTTGNEDLDKIPGYRGFMSVFLYNSLGFGWSIGTSPTPMAMSVECSSYAGAGVGFAIGDEDNPALVIYDLLVAKFGKLGYPKTLIDSQNFNDIAELLLLENMGYSRSFEDHQEASELIIDVLRQIDATLYVDPITGKVKLKLIRPDFDPLTVLELTPDNVVRLDNYAAGTWDNVINKVRVVFPDRAKDYEDNSATAQNQANAVGQDGEVREVVIQYRGCCNQTLAKKIAERELSARSRPITKCRAIVDRRFSELVHGDVVALTWPKRNLQRMMFRVANITLGDPQKREIALDLIQDFFAVHNDAFQAGQLPGFPIPGP